MNIEDNDILESIIGFDQSFTFAIVICVSTFSGSFPCYGMSKIMLLQGKCSMSASEEWNALPRVVARVEFLAKSQNSG